MSKYVWGDSETLFFYNLTPEVVLAAVESLGVETTGRCLTLNSMENRVYEIELALENEPRNPSEKFVIAKFYRPGRWKRKQILDEHQFLFDLKDAELPAIAPLVFNGESLFKVPDHEMFYCLFPKKGGRNPDEMNDQQLEQLGRTIARMHNVGATRKSEHRLHINPMTFGSYNLNFIKGSPHLPPHLKETYVATVEQIVKLSTPLFEDAYTQRIHGDCHLGNIIWDEKEGPFFIDFDDMLVGPPVQDIWLIAGGRDQESIRQRNVLLEGYEMMRDFDWDGLKLIEPLRALRFIHFSAWIAKRWEDPSFKSAFAHFDSPHYWEVQINDLREQLDLISQQLTRPAFF